MYNIQKWVLSDKWQARKKKFSRIVNKPQNRLAERKLLSFWIIFFQSSLHTSLLTPRVEFIWEVVEIFFLLAVIYSMSFVVYILNISGMGFS